MSKKKIAITVIAVLFAVISLAAGVLGFFMGYNSSENERDDNGRGDGDRTTLHSEQEALPPSGDNGTQNGNQGGSQGDAQEGVNNGNQGSVQSGDLAAQLLGKWRDVSGVSGFEFMAGGKVTLTYVDLGFIGINFVGDLNGVYTLEGDKLTISTSVYAGSIPIAYTASVSGDTLTLVSADNGSTFTYTRSEDTDADTGGDTSEPQYGQSTGIVGDWKDGMGMSGFNFKEDGTVSFTYIDLQFLGYEGLSGSYDGRYTVEGDNVTISFSVIYGPTFNLKFTYEISDNTLKLTNEKGNTTTYIRQ